MLNCSSEILKEITDYLASRHILYRAYAPVGIVTFSAGTYSNKSPMEQPKTLQILASTSVSRRVILFLQ